jgi:hypothetical protein
MAWLADTLLRHCDLGGALEARQRQVRISRQLTEGSPGNNELKSRCAFSLAGLSNVAERVEDFGRLDEATSLMEGTERSFRDIPGAEAYSNQRPYTVWAGFLLARSDMAWRGGDPVEAAAYLDQAISHLDPLLQFDSEGMSFRDRLSQARSRAVIMSPASFGSATSKPSAREAVEAAVAGAFQ